MLEFISQSSWICFALVAVGCLLVTLLVTGLVALPLILALITHLRHSITNNNNNNKPPWTSAMYVGRVWHTRHAPTQHAFTYPLFLFALDLEEVHELFGNHQNKNNKNKYPWLWPLTWIISFRDEDHLKNGEGMLPTTDGDANNSNDINNNNRLVDRVLRLAASKTDHKFRPTLQSHRVLLVTHLSYYGYCFNPVSFYFLQNKTDPKYTLDAVVAEVSNTPWNEMHCYVLHPENKEQQVQVMIPPPPPHDKSTPSSAQVMNYVFPKRFHVSPFMEMTYTYDWTFQNFLPHSGDDSGDSTSNIKITTAMNRNDQRHFSATMNTHPKGMHPMTLAWQMVTYPIYCMIIQLWIHYEAFWLFVKGIPFVPHPNAAETTASRIIGHLMVPFFALQAWWEGNTSSSTSSGKHDVGKGTNHKKTK